MTRDIPPSKPIPQAHVPPFTLAALETSIGKRLAVPAYEVRMIAAEIYDRFDVNTAALLGRR